VANLDAQGTDGVVHDFGFVCTKENQVAVFGACARQHFSDGAVVQVFNDGALQTVTAFGHIVDLDVGQAFGTINFDKLGVGVDLASAQTTLFACATWHTQSDYAAAFIWAAPENTLKSTSCMTWVTSVNSIFTRRSGLSEPYLNIASW